MKNTGTLKVTTPSDREIVLTRVFDAPKNLVFDAFSKPELLKRWFGTARLVAGGLRRGSEGGRRLPLRHAPVPTEETWGCAADIWRSHRPIARSTWSRSTTVPGESQVTAVFVRMEARPRWTATIPVSLAGSRDAVIKSGMEHGAARATTSWRELLAPAGIACLIGRINGQAHRRRLDDEVQAALRVARAEEHPHEQNERSGTRRPGAFARRLSRRQLLNYTHTRALGTHVSRSRNRTSPLFWPILTPSWRHGRLTCSSMRIVPRPQRV